MISGYDIDIDDIQFEKKPYDALDAYSRSKAANVLFSKALCIKLKVHHKKLYRCNKKM